MAVEETSRIEPYGFAEAFEEQVVFLLCDDEDFYRRIGFLIEPEGFANPLAQELTRTLHTLVEESILSKKRNTTAKVDIFERRKAKAKTSPLYVVQKLNQISREGGRIPNATVIAAMDYMERLTDKWDQEIDDESVIALLVPELKRRLQNKAINTAIGAYRDRKEFKDVQALLEEAAVLGDPTMALGAGTLSLSDNSTYEAIEALQFRNRIPTGMPDIDRELGGGVAESSFMCVMGGPGAGKSVWLGHIAVESVLAGEFTLYASLEVEPDIIMARFLANVTGIPITELHGQKLMRAKAMIGDIAPGMGDFEVEMFEPETTRVQHLKDWVHRKEQEYGKKCTQILIDYADLLGAGADNMMTYQAMKIVYRGLYAWAHKDKTRVLTASATKAKKDKKGTTDLDDASDSRHKARIVDIMGAIDRTPEGNFFSLPKNRTGKSLGVVGPFQDDFTCGRFMHTNRGNIHEWMERAKAYVAMGGHEQQMSAPAPAPVSSGTVLDVRGNPIVPDRALNDW